MRERGEETTMTTLQRQATVLFWAVVLLGVLAFGAVRAEAAPGIASFTTGASTTDAGAHADLRTSFEVNAKPDGTPDGRVRSVLLELPAGVAGNPNAVPQCSQETIGAVAVEAAGPAAGSLFVQRCPREAQVGRANIFVEFLTAPYEAAIFNAETAGDDAGRLLIAAPGLPPIYISIGARTAGDYGLSTESAEVDGYQDLRRIDLEVWGVPGAHTRGGDFLLAGFPVPMTDPLPPDPPELRRPFMTNPTVCDAPKVSNLAITFDEPGYPVHRASSTDPTPTNCAGVRFDPSITLQPTSSVADDATGVDVRLTVPQGDDPVGIATSHLRRAVVTLPEGTTLNPSSADGLQGCTDAQFGFGSNEPARCPDGSKVGTVRFEVPILPGSLNGEIFLGEPLGNDPQSGRMFRLFQYARGFGLTVKIPGYVRADPVTGRLTTTFGDLRTLYGAVPPGMLDGLPQVPFTDFTLRFKGGPRGMLATPLTGGSNATTTKLEPWSGNPDAQPTTSFDVRGAPTPAAMPFAPGFGAGVNDPRAGASSPFNLTLTRDGGHQELRGLSVEMPRGLLARISDVTEICQANAAAAGTCRETSRIGSVTTGAGAGPNPFFLSGRVYLTEGHRGGQFGLSIVVPAVAGPFNLGDVVVQAAIHVDRRDASLRIVSDPLPTMLRGVQLRIRHVGVRVDKPSFMVNPTNCDTMQVGGQVSSLPGAVRNVAARFKVGNCGAMSFEPRMTLTVGGRGRTQDGMTTPLRVALRIPRGHANQRSVDVTLPKAINARLRQVQDACTLEEYSAPGRPACRVVGSASAATPLLRDPLRGSAYFVRNPARRLPDLVVALRGAGVARLVEFDLVGKVKVTRDLTLRTTFDTVPDVPVTMFSLRLVAGRRGPVGIVRDLCLPRTRQALDARLAIHAQSGKRVTRLQRLQVVGCKTRATARRTSRSSGR